MEKLESDDASSKNTVNNEAKKNFKSMPDLSELHGRAQNATPAYTPQQKELAQRYDYVDLAWFNCGAEQSNFSRAMNRRATSASVQQIFM